MKKKCSGNLSNCLLQISDTSSWTKFFPPLEKNGIERVTLIKNGISAANFQLSKISMLAKQKGYDDIVKAFDETITWSSE